MIIAELEYYGIAVTEDILDCLPITESKKTIIAELEYYGIAVNEDSIGDTAANNLKYTKSLKEMMSTLQRDISSSGEKHYTMLQRSL